MRAVVFSTMARLKSFLSGLSSWGRAGCMRVIVGYCGRGYRARARIRYGAGIGH